MTFLCWGGTRTGTKTTGTQKSSFQDSKNLADCVNSSPPLISRKFQGFGGIWAILGKFGKFRENSGEFSGVLYGA